MIVDSGHDNAGCAQDTAGPADEAPRGPGLDGNGSHPFSERDMPDLGKLAQDWIVVWQSELAALAADPEIREACHAMTSIWAGTMAAMLNAMPRDATGTRHGPQHGRAHDRRDDRSAGRAGTADAPGATAAAAAPDPRDAEIDRLSHHVASLERRLAELEHGKRASLDPKRRSRRQS